MLGQLRHHDEESFVRCYICGKDAAGPCARCRGSVCGNCCVLVDGAAQKWAVCLRCNDGERTTVGGWRGLGMFFVQLLGVLVVLILILAWLFGDLG